MNGSPKGSNVPEASMAPPPAAANTTDAATRRNAVLARIETACAASHRAATSVQLLAVSKKFDGSHCLAMAQTGQTSFGENYLQEALAKQQWIADRWQGESLQWHFIGPIQSNKTRQIAEHFDWVHTVDRLKTGQRLNDQRPAQATPLQICLQVNIDHESSKSGCAPELTVTLVRQLAALPNLQLRGLMAIPSASTDLATQRGAFARVRALFKQCQAALKADQHPQMGSFDTLSMGMTGDLEAAIAEGATIVRVGTALFGQRAAKPV